MSEEATRNDEVAAATVAASETLGEKDEAQATRIDRRCSKYRTYVKIESQ